jgi:hypothetical protein
MKMAWRFKARTTRPMLATSGREEASGAVLAEPEKGSVTTIRDAAAIMISVGQEMKDVLGWLPEQLIGRPSTEFIHPEDQPSAVVAWFQMIDSSTRSTSLRN